MTESRTVAPRFTETEADAALQALTAAIANQRAVLDDKLEAWGIAGQLFIAAVSTEEREARLAIADLRKAELQAEYAKLTAFSAARIALSDAIA